MKLSGDDRKPQTNDHLIDQIRTVVDQDVTDPSEWYKIIIAVRDLVGVTR
jgi:hypothetical protein